MVDKRAVAHAETLIRQACRLAGPFRMIDQNRSALQRRGVIRALRDHDTPVLFDWLMSIVSYQGIADRVADQYIRYHGNITWGSIKRDLKANPPCPKLAGYWPLTVAVISNPAAPAPSRNIFMAAPCPPIRFAMAA